MEFSPTKMISTLLWGDLMQILMEEFYTQTSVMHLLLWTHIILSSWCKGLHTSCTQIFLASVSLTQELESSSLVVLWFILKWRNQLSCLSADWPEDLSSILETCTSTLTVLILMLLLLTISRPSYKKMDITQLMLKYNGWLPDLIKKVLADSVTTSSSRNWCQRTLFKCD